MLYLFMAGRKPISRIYCTKSYLLRHMQCFHYEINRSSMPLIYVWQEETRRVCLQHSHSMECRGNTFGIYYSVVPSMVLGTHNFLSLVSHFTLHIPLHRFPRGEKLLPSTFLKEEAFSYWCTSLLSSITTVSFSLPARLETYWLFPILCKILANCPHSRIPSNTDPTLGPVIISPLLGQIFKL